MNRTRAFPLFLFVSAFALLASAQDNKDDFDFSDLDSVEKEEFGSDAKKSKSDSSDYDLELDDKKGQAGESTEDLEKELDEMDPAQKTGKKLKPADDTVDLEKELGEIEAEPTPPLEEASKGQPKAEDLPPLEQPKEAPPEEQPPAPVVEQQPGPTPVDVPPVVENSDEPDAKLEARMNRIYQKFMGNKTTDEEWLQIAGDKASETYAIQPGDTLWGISVTFFGNGQFWPKVWQLNDEITNPHVIRPGNSIRFQPGTLTDSPSMEVTENESAGEGVTAADGGDLPPEADVSAEPTIPPPQRHRAALKTIPPSLPPLVLDDEGLFDSTGFAIDKSKPAISPPLVAVTSYLLEEEPPPLGEVVGTEISGSTTAAKYQYVFIKCDQAQIGETFTAYNVGRKIKFDGDMYGFPIEFEGTLKVVDRVNDDEPIFKALVTSSVQQIHVGSPLSKEPIPHVVLDKNGTENPATGQVIGGEFDNVRKVLGMGNFVYLDMGSNQGVNNGDILRVLRNEKIRHTGGKFVKKSTKFIGKIKIAKTTAGRSTGVVVESSDAIIPGDIVGGSGMASNTSGPPPSEEEFSTEDPSPPADTGGEPSDTPDELGEEIDIE